MSKIIFRINYLFLGLLVIIVVWIIIIQAISMIWIFYWIFTGKFLADRITKLIDILDIKMKHNLAKSKK